MLHRIVSRPLHGAAAIALALTAVAAAQLPEHQIREDFWVPDDSVEALAATNQTLYVAGHFSYVGPLTGAFGLLDSATASVQTGLPLVRDAVWSIVDDGAGGWYIGGEFSTVDDMSVQHLCHLLPDGSLDPLMPDVAGDVRSMALVGNTLYLGGFFEEVAGEDREGLAAIDVSTGELLPFNPSVVGKGVNVLLAHDETLYVGGGFSQIGGVPRQNLASIDLTSSGVTAWNPAPTGFVLELLAADSRLYVGGNFTTIASEPRGNLAAFELAGGGLLPFDLPANSGVGALVVDGPTLYVGGSFTMLDGFFRSGLAAIDLTTESVLPFLANIDGNDGASPTVSALVLTGVSDLLVAGSFLSIGAAPRAHLAMVNRQTGAPTGWRADVSNPSAAQVRTAVRRGDELAIGGDLHSIGGEPRTGLAAFDTSTGEALPWSPGEAIKAAFDEVIFEELLISGSTVYACGAWFTNQPEPLLVAIDAITGDLLPTFTPPDEPSGSIITSIRRVANTLFAGLDDGTGQGLHGVARYHASSGTLLSPIPLISADHDVITLELNSNGSVLYFGGAFSTPGGRAAALQTGPLTLNSWDPGVNMPVSDLLHTPEAVYIAGEFTQVGGTPQFRLAAVDPVTAKLLPWDPDVDGDEVLALARIGENIVIGGSFDSVGSIMYGNLRLVTPSGEATTWWPSPSTEVRALATSESLLAAGGGFSSVLQHQRPYLVAFDIETCPADIDDSDGVDVDDLVAVIVQWGDCTGCEADVDMNGSVDVDDLVALILAWGPCL